ncbi:MAG: SigE family RNA polymerase sigma factor [Actinomycetota bacterium]
MADWDRPDGLREYVAVHHDRLFRYSVLLTGERTLAEDLSQEVFARVGNKLQGVKQDRMWPYLRQAATNLWRNSLRRRSIERRAQVRLTPVEVEDEGDRIVIPDEVWSAIAHLPAKQRISVVLRFYEDLTINEIASAMRCPEGTVKSNLHRALKRLREELER